VHKGRLGGAANPGWGRDMVEYEQASRVSMWMRDPPQGRGRPRGTGSHRWMHTVPIRPRERASEGRDEGRRERTRFGGARRSNVVLGTAARRKSDRGVGALEAGNAGGAKALTSDMLARKVWGSR